MPYGTSSSGRVASASSRLAVICHVAASLAGKKLEDQADWLQAIGISIGTRALKDAIKARKRQPDGHDTRGIPPSGAASTQAPSASWLSPSLEVDTFGLNLDAAVLLIPAADASAAVLREVSSTSGVVEVIHTYDHGVLVRLVFAGRQRREELRTKFETLCGDIQWMEVRAEDRAPAPTTWRDLAQQVAADEGRA